MLLRSPVEQQLGQQCLTLYGQMSFLFTGDTLPDSPVVERFTPEPFDKLLCVLDPDWTVWCHSLPSFIAMPSVLPKTMMSPLLPWYTVGRAGTCQRERERRRSCCICLGGHAKTKHTWRNSGGIERAFYHSTKPFSVCVCVCVATAF